MAAGGKARGRIERQGIRGRNRVYGPRQAATWMDKKG